MTMTLSRRHARGEMEKWVTRVWRWRRDEGRRVSCYEEEKEEG